MEDQPYRATSEGKCGYTLESKHKEEGGGFKGAES